MDESPAPSPESDFNPYGGLTEAFPPREPFANRPPDQGGRQETELDPTHHGGGRPPKENEGPVASSGGEPESPLAQQLRESGAVEEFAPPPVTRDEAIKYEYSLHQWAQFSDEQREAIARGKEPSGAEATALEAPGAPPPTVQPAEERVTGARREGEEAVPAIPLPAAAAPAEPEAAQPPTAAAAAAPTAEPPPAAEAAAGEAAPAEPAEAAGPPPQVTDEAAQPPTAAAAPPPSQPAEEAEEAALPAEPQVAGGPIPAPSPPAEAPQPSAPSEAPDTKEGLPIPADVSERFDRLFRGGSFAEEEGGPRMIITGNLITPQEGEPYAMARVVGSAEKVQLPVSKLVRAAAISAGKLEEEAQVLADKVRGGLATTPPGPEAKTEKVQATPSEVRKLDLSGYSPQELRDDRHKLAEDLRLLKSAYSDQDPQIARTQATLDQYGAEIASREAQGQATEAPSPPPARPPAPQEAVGAVEKPTAVVTQRIINLAQKLEEGEVPTQLTREAGRALRQLGVTSAQLREFEERQDWAGALKPLSEAHLEGRLKLKEGAPSAPPTGEPATEGEELKEAKPEEPATISAGRFAEAQEEIQQAKEKGVLARLPPGVKAAARKIGYSNKELRVVDESSDSKKIGAVYDAVEQAIDEERLAVAPGFRERARGAAERFRRRKPEEAEASRPEGEEEPKPGRLERAKEGARRQREKLLRHPGETAKGAAKAGAEAAGAVRAKGAEILRAGAEKTPLTQFLYRQGEAFLNKADWRDKEIVAWALGMGFGAGNTAAAIIFGPFAGFARAPLIVGINFGGTSIINKLRLRSIEKALKPYIRPEPGKDQGKFLAERAREFDNAFKLIRGQNYEAFQAKIKELTDKFIAEFGNPTPESTPTQEAQNAAVEEMMSKMNLLNEKYAKAQNNIRSFVAGMSVGSIGSALGTNLIIEKIFGGELGVPSLPNIPLSKPGVPGILKGKPGLERVPGFGGPKATTRGPERPPPMDEEITPRTEGPLELKVQAPAGVDQDTWNIYRNLSPEERTTFNEIAADPDRLDAFNRWVTAHEAASVQEIVANPDYSSAIDIARGDTVGQLLVDHDFDVTWTTNDAELFGTHIYANYDMLKEMNDNVAASGVAVEGFPTQEELADLIRAASAGDTQAMHQLTETLHWIPAGGKINILTPAGIEAARRALRLG